MKIEKFKQWFQVRNNGYTLAQFLTYQEAVYFLRSATQFTAADLHLGNEGVSMNKGYTTRRISVYP